MQRVKATTWWYFLALVTIVMALQKCLCRPTTQDLGRVRIATFNIENFPKNSQQIERAFVEIQKLGASIVALQEIEQPVLTAREARNRLGTDWDFVYVDTSPLPRYAHHNGVLFDRRVWTLVSTATHDETRLEHNRHKPTFEVRLAPVAGGDIVSVLVVHLKSGSDGRAIRERQLTALAGIVREVGRSGERVVVLGDFNATEDDDRADIARVADAGELAWATEELACSAFWRRDDGCPRSRLDHVLTWTAPASVEAGGACATEGCDWEESCPIYREQVSDHCPVVVEL